jgi:hypothetical protein
MKVYELIELLRKMPLGNDVFIDDGEYVDKVCSVRHDSRDYVIISPHDEE